MTNENAIVIATGMRLSGAEATATAQIDYLMETFPKEIEEFTVEDFVETEMPFAYIDLFAYDKLKREQVFIKVQARFSALKIGGKNAFKAMWAGYKKRHPDAKADEDKGGVTRFSWQPTCLLCGEWIADDIGVRKIGSNGEVIWACMHPILPVARLKNIETGIEKIKVAFKNGSHWKTCIFDRKTLSVASKIVDLSDYGIAATSDNAAQLVRYFLTTLQSNGEEYIPELRCITHLGWTDGGEFVPYVENIEFDGEKEFSERFKSVKLVGSERKWIEGLYKHCISKEHANVVSRIVMAASVASVLVKPMNINNFWVHLWGESGTAKTVLTMCATSEWANPEIGKYIVTFNSTYVGNERNTAFCGSMPYMLDELQILDSRKDTDSLVYMLTEGCGRSRGNRSGGIEYVPKWRNCIISSGEKPISSQNSGGGVAARVIEIEVKDKLFGGKKDIETVLETIENNYGFIGKRFIEQIKAVGNSTIKEIFRQFSGELIKRGVMDKQAQSAALILTADFLMCKSIMFIDDALSVDEIMPFLKTNEEVDVSRRAYDYICGKIIENQTKFVGTVEKQMEIWGKFGNGDIAYIVKTRFDELCNNGGYAPKPLLSWLVKNKLIETDAQGQFTRPVSINGRLARCVCLKIPRDTSSDVDIAEYGF